MCYRKAFRSLNKVAIRVVGDCGRSGGEVVAVKELLSVMAHAVNGMEMKCGQRMFWYTMQSIPITIVINTISAINDTQLTIAKQWSDSVWNTVGTCEVWAYRISYDIIELPVDVCHISTLHSAHHPNPSNPIQSNPIHMEEWSTSNSEHVICYRICS